MTVAKESLLDKVEVEVEVEVESSESRVRPCCLERIFNLKFLLSGFLRVKDSHRHFFAPSLFRCCLRLFCTFYR